MESDWLIIIYLMDSLKLLVHTYWLKVQLNQCSSRLVCPTPMLDSVVKQEHTNLKPSPKANEAWQWCGERIGRPVQANGNDECIWGAYYELFNQQPGRGTKEGFPLSTVRMEKHGLRGPDRSLCIFQWHKARTFLKRWLFRNRRPALEWFLDQLC